MVKSKKRVRQKRKLKTFLWGAIILVGALSGLGLLFFQEESETKTAIAEITVHKKPNCDCCIRWINHIRAAGFKVTIKDHGNMSSIKTDFGVEPELRSCHTAIVDGYVIEGHVPADEIIRLLQERPKVAGLTVPGMPQGSPGMESHNSEPYDILAFDNNRQTKVYASYKK
jgi:hypothetical protein